MSKWKTSPFEPTEWRDGARVAYIPFEGGQDICHGTIWGEGLLMDLEDGISEAVGVAISDLEGYMRYVGEEDDSPSIAKTHIMGLDPEELNRQAYDDFMRGL